MRTLAHRFKPTSTIAIPSHYFTTAKQKVPRKTGGASAKAHNQEDSHSHHTSTPSNSTISKQQQQKEQWKSSLLFGFGLYLGLSLFGTTRVNGETREGSSYLQDLKDNLDRTSGIAPTVTETETETEVMVE